jgi:acetolactate synthase-1/2/3 large subunit
VDTLEAFDESLKLALESKKPCVLDVWVDLEEIPRSLQQRADLLTAAFAR